MRLISGGNKPGDVDATLISRLVHSRDTDVNEIAQSQEILEEKIDLMSKEEKLLSRLSSS
uniref:Uncharacterized protein n=1 Tax=Lutzomyia longipalpis TaxID=7200 RepID=A0A1B0CG04_LUTLO